jgi:hypothetical protein
LRRNQLRNKIKVLLSGVMTRRPRHLLKGIAMSRLARLLLLMGVVGLMALVGYAGRDRPPPDAIEAPEIARELAVAAQRFLDTLEPGTQATYLFQDSERGNFHFFPVSRRGVALKQLKEGQRHLALALMSATLSHVGNQKALTIMSLGDYLRATDTNPNIHRDSDQYHVTLFGTPSVEGTWGYRFEGFHLSLNVTVVRGRWIAVTPSFLGAIPATVPDGPRKGLQVLKEETELGRALAQSLTALQRKAGFGKIPDFLTETVGGFVTGNKRKLERGTPRGLAAADMTADQRATLMKLVRVHIGRIRKELADQDLARIDRAGREKIHFQWAGGLKAGEPHHYLIQGPTFLIEYDNTQDDANHVHCIYRDFDHDFGDALVEHYQNKHRKP